MKSVRLGLIGEWKMIGSAFIEFLELSIASLCNCLI